MELGRDAMAPEVSPGFPNNTRPKGRQKRILPMKKYTFAALIPVLLTATALSLALSVGAQASDKAENPKPEPMMGDHHHMGEAAGVEHDADMMAECQTMRAKHQEMQDKRQAMDTKLDELVAKMNAASTSKEPDAMEKPMAAVLTELVAQRKANRSMMMEMQPGMMGHMMHHQGMHGTKGAMGTMGAMNCPMMKADETPEAKAEETKPED